MAFLNSRFWPVSFFGAQRSLCRTDDSAHHPPAHVRRRDYEIGVDTRTSVDDFEHRVPFQFTGKIDKLTYNLGPEQLSAEGKAAAAKILAAAKD